MIDENKVMKAFEDMAKLSCDEAAKQRGTVHLCCVGLAQRLKDEQFENDVRIIRLAAAECNCCYVLESRGGDGEITSMKAGDVTVSRADNSLEKAFTLRDRAFVLALPLLADEQFLFAGV